MEHRLFSNCEQSDRPKKQGGLYSLDLGKNIGPFLPKDIMPNNPKSISLLVGTEIVRSHIVMVKSLEETQAKMKKSDSSLRSSLKVKQDGLTCAENLIDFSTYLETEILHVRKQAEQLTQDQRRFKGQLEELQQYVNSRNLQNTTELSPLLKDLYNKVKEGFNQQKNDLYKLTRQLQAVSREKNTLVQQVVMCEGRIRTLQELVGISHHQYDQIDSSQSETSRQQ